MHIIKLFVSISRRGGLANERSVCAFQRTYLTRGCHAVVISTLQFMIERKSRCMLVRIHRTTRDYDPPSTSSVLCLCPQQPFCSSHSLSPLSWAVHELLGQLTAYVTGLPLTVREPPQTRNNHQPIGQRLDTLKSPRVERSEDQVASQETLNDC